MMNLENCKYNYSTYKDQKIIDISTTNESKNLIQLLNKLVDEGHIDFPKQIYLDLIITTKDFNSEKTFFKVPVFPNYQIDADDITEKYLDQFLCEYQTGYNINVSKYKI